MSVAELNAAAVSVGLADAKGAIVGGINAAAKRKRRPHVLTGRDVGGKRMFAMRCELQPLFREVLERYPEADLLTV